MSIKSIRKIGLGILIGTLMFGMTLYADTLATINSDNVMMKRGPWVESVDIVEMEKGGTVRIGDSISQYIEILHDNQVAGYIGARYITINEPEPTPEAVAEIKAEVEATQEAAPAKPSKGEEVVAFALKHVGNPYRYGGNSLTNGTDCSGFTSSVYRHFGVNIQRTSRGQYASNGKSVKRSELQPGDLIFTGYNGRVSHVAIYMGNNKIVHASTSKTGICIGDFRRGGAPFIGAKRIFE